MFKKGIVLAIAILSIWGASVANAALPLNQGRYDVYYGDIDSVEYGLDGRADILLRARQQYAMITLGIAFPIPIESGYQDLLFCGRGSGAFTPCTMTQGASIPATPSNQFDFLVGDFDGDGVKDLLLQSKNQNINSLYLRNDNQGRLVLKDQFQKIGGYWVSGGSGISVGKAPGGNGDVLIFDDFRYSQWSGNSFSEPRSINLNTSLVGSSASSFSVDLGQAEFSLPIQVPKGGAGVDPSFSIHYSSGSGYGQAGMGFSISGVSAIERCGYSFERDGAVSGVKGNNGDLLCLDGNRLILVSGQYWGNGSVYQTEAESDRKIVYSQGGFTVHEKNGDVMYYGSRADTRITGRLSGNAVGRWVLDGVEDRLGYGYRVTYQPGSAGYFPQKIEYTVKDGQAGSGDAEVEFTYEPDPYGWRTAVLGKVYRVGLRLARVTSRSHGSVARQYHFRYETSQATKRSLLTRFFECDASARCFKPITLNWKKERQPDFSKTTYSRFPGTPSTEYVFEEGLHYPGFARWVDINRDKYDDYCRISGTGAGYSSPAEIICYLSNGNGGFGSQIKIDAGLVGTRLQQHDDAPSPDWSRHNWNVDPAWIDINDDGLVDLCYSTIQGGNDRLTCRLNKPNLQNAFKELVTFDVSRPVDKFFVGPRSWMDFNGNGKIDYCYTYLKDEKKYIRCLVQSVNGFTFSEAFTKEITDMAGYWADVNGDGLPDYCITTKTKITCHINNQGQGLNGGTWAKTGTHFQANEPDRWVYKGSSTKYFSALFTDFTGNGFSDFCRIYWTTSNGKGGYRASCLESLGDGWGNEITSPFLQVTPTTAQDYERMPEATQFMDVNQDGRMDWCVENTVPGVSDTHLTCFISTPDGFGASSAKYRLPYLGSNIRGMRDINRGWADINGDGHDSYCALYWKSLVPRNRGMACFGPQVPEQGDLLTGVTNGFGLEYGVTYKDIADPSVYAYGGPTGSHGQVFLTKGMNVVSELEASDGIGGYNTQQYFYRNYGYYPNEFGGVGFELLRVTSENGRKRHDIWFNQDVRNHTVGQVDRSETYYKVGGGFQLVSSEENEWQTQIYRGQGFPLQSASNIWNRSGISLRYRSLLKGSVSKEYELDGSLIKTVESSNTYKNTGDLLTQEVATSGTGQTFTKRLVNQYLTNNLTYWILGRQSRSEATYSGSYQGQATPTITRTSAWTYYSASQPGIGGMLQSEIVEPDQPVLRKETRYTYNAYGLTETRVEKGAGGAERSTQFTYDPTGRFVVETRNTLGHTSKATYDPVLGVKLTESDPNNVTTRWNYDSLGRPLTEFSADGQRRETRIKACISNCPANAVYYTESWLAGRNGTPISGPTREYTDLLGRTIETRATGFAGETIVAKTEYDANGDVTRTSEPHELGGAVYWNQVMSRDVLGRPLVERSASGLTSNHQYSGLTTQQTVSWSDPVGGGQTTQVTVHTNDVQDRLRRVVDAANRQLTYQYDASGKLLKVVLPDQVELVNTYDALGRKVGSQDPNIGQWQYAYDDFDQIVLQQNGSGARTCSAYDELGRLISRTDDYRPSLSWAQASQAALNGCAGQTATHSWSYDAPAKGVGRLALVTANNGYREEPFYDGIGRVVQVDTRFDGRQFTRSSQFDSNTGRLVQETLPHRINGPSLSVEYRYNAQGELHEIGKPGEEDYYWRANAKTVRGQIKDVYQGNGIIRKLYDHDPVSGFLTQIRSKMTFDTAWGIQNEFYDFDAKGLMRKRTQQAVGNLEQVEETFAYDVVDRLVQATVANMTTPGNSFEQSIDYDVSGNILQRNDVGQYQYGESCEVGGTQYTPGPHAVTSVTGTRNASYCYDSGGNMLAGGGKTISYTAFNKPDQIQGTSATVDLVYGPDRSILKQVTTTSEKTTNKISLGGYEYLDIQKNGQTTIKERFRITGDVVVSFENGDATSPNEEHLFMDGMGSVVAVAHGLGGVTERYRYDPWGRPRKDVDWTAISDAAWFGMERAEKATSKGYTGHEMLDDVGIIHMGGRIYDPTIGRFLSADPVIKGLDQVESYNRYSYALNNPMSITDPSGYSWLSKTWKKLRNSIKKRMGIVLAVFNPQMAIAEVTSRYAGKEMARFAARNKYAGEVFGIVGMVGCSIGTGGGAGACFSAYQSWVAGAVTYGSGAPIEKALLAGAKSAALAYADARVNKFIGRQDLRWYNSGIAHGARGAAFARMRGADVRSGLIGGMTEGMLGDHIEDWTDGKPALGAAVAGLISGSVSEATGGKFMVGAATGAMGYLFNQMSTKEERNSPSWERFKQYIKEHVRVGWLASFTLKRGAGITIDLGSAKLSDETGGYWTESGYIKTFSEGRTLTEFDLPFLGGVSAENITRDNGATWSYGTPKYRSSAVMDVLRGKGLTLDVSIGLGVVYEDSIHVFGGD
ncbi:RHS repeat-associated core domain-containing protein [Alloalcanivorax xenomutans]|uniref:RHS repeat domain-containing protein n=1 Tax=Alloalcanivorax xenomutans TaxID=1094342 RepID=UPI002934E4CD|nr:RHS repeat-associated core domain-containing protein [Alloalcanivorax xenomutans]WOD30083.1 RHS repeat-associated core domain-containing protein [Alloalcanivorax xenomutans]